MNKILMPPQMNEIENTRREIDLPGVGVEAERMEIGSEEEDLLDQISGAWVVRLLCSTPCSPSEKCISCRNTRMTETLNRQYGHMLN